ncbi:MAG: ATPase, partial [Candidatus Dormibacteraceae bacterium]
QVFSDRPDEPIEVIFTLTETDGRTTLTILEEHPSQRYRDEHLAMEESMPGKLDRLEQLMKSVH